MNKYDISVEVYGFDGSRLRAHHCDGCYRFPNLALNAALNALDTGNSDNPGVNSVRIILQQLGGK